MSADNLILRCKFGNEYRVADVSMSWLSELDRKITYTEKYIDGCRFKVITSKVPDDHMDCIYRIFKNKISFSSAKESEEEQIALELDPDHYVEYGHDNYMMPWSWEELTEFISI